MSQNLQNGMSCTEFEALLTEAVESQLDLQKMQAFRNHSTECALCGPLFAKTTAAQIPVDGGNERVV